MLATILAATVLFTDDFEHGLDRWQVQRAPFIRVVDSNDASHGKVMLLETAGDQYALIKGSEKWIQTAGVALDADVLFLTPEDNYLGVIYNYQHRGTRDDFGVIYIKGNQSYLQANPHRDFNVSRLVYPEYHVDLKGAAAIETGKWQHFKLEVSGSTAHLYVGDMTTPQMTFPFFELTSGAVGVQPRCCGGPVWIDNVRVTPIAKLSYDGPPIPKFDYAPQSVITDWQVAGPFTGAKDDVARDPSKFTWKPFPTDARGAVITAKVVDYVGPNSAAYFRTRVESETARPATLLLSTADDVAVWINGRFRAFNAKNDAAWFDFVSNHAHVPRKISIDLRAGTNDIVIRIRGGISATGGFFARVE